jgi:glycosyltransferase involved in cell wall biosynthesis
VLTPLLDQYEIIFIDDSSTNPGTWSMMKSLRNQDARIKIIQLFNNHGQQKAILCGIMHARGKYIITMDDDLQHAPEEIPKLFHELIDNEEIEVVIGVPPIGEKRHDLMRNIGTYCVDKLDRVIFGKPSSIRRGSFRIMRARLASNLVKVANESPTIGSLILAVTQRIKTIRVKHEQRAEGGSGYSYYKLVSLGLDNIINHSSLPLKIVAALGGIYCVLSICLSAWAIYNKFAHGINVPGWTSLIVIQAISGGVIMAGLGAIGEYLIRINKNLRGKRPIILIRQGFMSDVLEDDRKIDQ